MCWLDGLATRLPVAIPEAVARGEPDLGYPWPWAVFRWIDAAHLGSRRRRQLRPSRPTTSPASSRRCERSTLRVSPAPSLTPLPTLASSDGGVRSALDAATGMVDTDAVRGAWERALRVPSGRARECCSTATSWRATLVRERRLHAVIDWAGVRRGDPARDLMAAWTLFRGESRRRFREAVDADDDTWSRARGWALTRISNVAYYATTNPRFAADAVATITEALADEVVANRPIGSPLRPAGDHNRRGARRSSRNRR